MSEITVSCAGCGKRYKGPPSTRKFKCGGCANLFTFPDGERKAPAGRTLCSFCWIEVPLHDELKACPNCNQKVMSGLGGASAVSSGLSPATPSEGHNAELQGALAASAQQREELLAVVQQLEARVAELESALAVTTTERDQAQANLSQLKDAAVAALEPLSLDYNRVMKQLIVETEELLSQARLTRQEADERMNAIEGLGARLSDHVKVVRRDMATRLSGILGTDAELTPLPTPRDAVLLDGNRQNNAG